MKSVLAIALCLMLGACSSATKQQETSTEAGGDSGKPSSTVGTTTTATSTAGTTPANPSPVDSGAAPRVRRHRTGRHRDPDPTRTWSGYRQPHRYTGFRARRELAAPLHLSRSGRMASYLASSGPPVVEQQPPRVVVAERRKKVLDVSVDQVINERRPHRVHLLLGRPNSPTTNAGRPSTR